MMATKFCILVNIIWFACLVFFAWRLFYFFANCRIARTNGRLLCFRKLRCCLCVFNVLTKFPLLIFRAFSDCRTSCMSICSAPCRCCTSRRRTIGAHSTCIRFAYLENLRCAWLRLFVLFTAALRVCELLGACVWSTDPSSRIACANCVCANIVVCCVPSTAQARHCETDFVQGVQSTVSFCWF